MAKVVGQPITEEELEPGDIVSIKLSYKGNKTEDVYGVAISLYGRNKNTIAFFLKSKEETLKHYPKSNYYTIGCDPMGIPISCKDSLTYRGYIDFSKYRSAPNNEP